MSRSSQRSTIKDMTNGSPAKLILGFAVPMLMGLLFQQFYSMVDTIIVGKFLGVDALASVGSTSAINFMINGFVIGVCTGFSIPVAQRFGAQDYKDMRRFVANAGWIASCFAVVMTVIVCLMTRQILVWMQTPDNIIDGAYSYIFFVFAGIPATYLYNTLAGIIRALGDSKTPVYFLILSSLLNIALDLLFIVQIGTGTAGAAYATVISQAVSGILCLIYMKKKFEILHMHHEETRISGRHLNLPFQTGQENVWKRPALSIRYHQSPLCNSFCNASRSAAASSAFNVIPFPHFSRFGEKLRMSYFGSLPFHEIRLISFV